MTRWIAGLVLVAACAAEDDKNPSPVGGTVGGVSVTAGAQGETGPGDDDDGASGSMGGDTDGMLADLGMDTLLQGQFLAGEPNIVTPVNCALRLFEAGAVDPATGNINEVTLQIPIVVNQLPQTYRVSVGDAAGVITVGQAIYATVICDIDQDGQFDNLGGFYPELPLELFQLPANGIDMELFFL